MFKKLLLSILPLRILSKLAGILSGVKFPPLLLQTFLVWYCRKFKVNLSEMADPLATYQTFGEFFIRNLKLGLRPLEIGEKLILSPVDGFVSQGGIITNNNLLQVKGKEYSLTSLVDKKSAKIFQGGSYLTIYLSPADYHHIHAPADGEVERVSHFPGQLFPVNNWAAANIDGLFCRNDRILTIIKNDHGYIGLLKVGALVVGKISLNYSQMNSNKSKVRHSYYEEKLKDKFKLLVGMPIARFELGSTVILLFAKNKVKLASIVGSRILLGEKIAAWN